MKTMVAMVLVVALVVLAVLNDINGLILAGGMSLISGLGGYSIKELSGRRKR